MAIMTIFEWTQLIALGGLAGAVGQGARAIIGLKKAHDAASSANARLGQMIEASKLFVSLGIGFVAGALSAIFLIQDIRLVPSQQIFALIAAGYAGGDLIEGLISRVPGTTDAAPGQEAIGVPSTATADNSVG